MATYNDLGGQIASERQRDLMREAAKERLAGQITGERSGLGMLLLLRRIGAGLIEAGHALKRRERADAGEPVAASPLAAHDGR